MRALQEVPLSDAVMAVLRAMKGDETPDPNDLV